MSSEVSALAFDGHRLANLKKLFGTISDLITAIDPEKIKGLIGSIMGIVGLIAPLFPAKAGEATVMSHDTIAKACEVHRASIEAEGFNFGAMVTLITTVMPLIKRMQAGDWNAFPDLVSAIMAFIGTLKTA